MHCPHTVLFSPLCKGQKYYPFLDNGSDHARLSAHWAQGFPAITDLLAQHRCLQSSEILLIVYPFVSWKESVCQSCWQRTLSLRRQNVFSSYYRKQWFIPFEPQSYFVCFKNRDNYILESFANEILKLISVIEFTAMLFGSTEEEGRREVKYIKSIAILPAFQRAALMFLRLRMCDIYHKLCGASWRERFRCVFCCELQQDQTCLSVPEAVCKVSHSEAKVLILNGPGWCMRALPTNRLIRCHGRNQGMWKAEELWAYPCMGWGVAQKCSQVYPTHIQE